MTGYTDGRAVEYRAMSELDAAGYLTLRTAGSHGVADIVAIGHGQILMVNVKRTTPPGPAERGSLLGVVLALANATPIPLIAMKPRGQSHCTYRRLTGLGPRDHTEWTPPHGTPPEPPH